MKTYNVMIKGMALSIILGFVGMYAEIVTLESNDGKTADVELNIAQRSKTLKNLIGDAGIEAPLPLININFATLEKVISSLPKLDSFLIVNEQVSPEEQMYIPYVLQPSINEELGKASNEEVLAFYYAVNYLDIPFLLNAAAAVIADRIPENLRIDTAKFLMVPGDEQKALLESLTKEGLAIGSLPNELKLPILRHVEFRLCGIEKEYSIADYINEHGQPPLQPCAVADYGIHLQNKGLTSLFGITRIKDRGEEEEEIVSLLDLSGNCFQDLKADLQGVDHPFVQLRHLTWLNLSNNKISNLPDGFFLGLNALWDIKLGNNRIQTMPENSIAELQELRSIDLKNNRLTDLPENFFSGKPELVKIKMEGNQFTKVPKIAHLPSLRNLHLNNNKITSVAGAFWGQTSLEEIRLSNNDIQEVSSEEFADHNDLPALSVVTLFGNPVADSKESRRKLKYSRYEVRFVFA